MRLAFVNHYSRLPLQTVLSYLGRSWQFELNYAYTPLYPELKQSQQSQTATHGCLTRLSVVGTTPLKGKDTLLLPCAFFGKWCTPTWCGTEPNLFPADCREYVSFLKLLSWCSVASTDDACTTTCQLCSHGIMQQRRNLAFWLEEFKSNQRSLHDWKALWDIYVISCVLSFASPKWIPRRR